MGWLSKPKDLQKKLLLCFLSVLFTLVLLEVVLRVYVWAGGVEVYYPPSEFVEAEGKLHTFDPELGWTLKPNFEGDGFSTNAFGFRSSIDHTDPDQAEKPRVILLGDSMVYGAGVDQEIIFSEVLNHQHPEYCFVNMGVVGYNTVQEYFALKRRIEEINPEYVVLIYVHANDLWTNARPRKGMPGFSLKGDELVFQPPRKSWGVPLYQKLMLTKFLFEHVLPGRDLTYLYQRSSFALREGNAYDWQVTKRILQQLGTLCREKGIQLAVLDCPTPRQSRKEKGDARQALLRGVAEEEGWVYFNLLEHCPSDRMSAFLPRDPHWNEVGHQYIADLIYDEVLPALKSTTPAATDAN